MLESESKSSRNQIDKSMNRKRQLTIKQKAVNEIEERQKQGFSSFLSVHEKNKKCKNVMRANIF